MARFTFGGGTADYVADANGRGLSSRTVTFYDAETGGSQLTDLLDGNGTPVTSITSGAAGRIPQFQGPDGVTGLWADAGGSFRSRLDAIDDEAPSDAAVATLLANPASAARAALDAGLSATYGAKEKVENDATVAAAFGGHADRVGFIPNRIRGLVLDLDADLCDGADGASVSSLPDQSGLGNHLNAASTTAPILKTGANGLNGHKVVRLGDGGASTWLGRTTGLTGIPNRAPFTVFVVCKPRVSATGQHLFNHTGGTAIGWGIELMSSGYISLTRYGGSANHTFQTYQADRPTIITASINTSLQVDVSRENFYLDKITTAADVTQTPTRLYLGSRYATDGFAQVDVARVLVYNRELTRAEKLRVNRHLNERYAITPQLNTPYNAPTALTVPTYEGSGQTTHPDVQVIPASSRFAAHSHVMMHTPYPGQDSSKENPSLSVSADGETGWADPAGVTNPIVAGLPGGAYNSDGDLYLHPPTDTLYTVWRQVNPGAPLEQIKVISTTDPTLASWSAQATLLDSTNAQAPLGLTNGALLSPSLTYDESTGLVNMFTVREAVSGPPAQRFLDRWTATNPAGPYTLVTAGINVRSTTNPTSYPYDVWHIDINWRDGVWYGLFNDKFNLFFGTSLDGDNWNVNRQPVMTYRADATKWDSAKLYRSCFAFSDDGRTIRVWYSGARFSGGVYTEKVGYTEVPATELPAPFAA